jgi:hypothetical protein
VAIAEQAARASLVGHKGLHEAFHAAHMLAEPHRQPGRGFFQRIGWRFRDAVAGAHWPESKVGILGDVPRIPAADLTQHGGAKMVAGATEQHGEAGAHEPGSHRIEQHRVSHGEHAGQQVVIGIVDRQPVLEAGSAGMVEHLIARLPAQQGAENVWWQHHHVGSSPKIVPCQRRQTGGRGRQGNAEARPLRPARQCRPPSPAGTAHRVPASVAVRARQCRSAWPVTCSDHQRRTCPDKSMGDHRREMRQFFLFCLPTYA